MRILVLDTRNGEEISDLFIADPATRKVDQLRLNYVPEFTYDHAWHQLLVVDTELDDRHTAREARYWLKFYDGESLELVRKIETPARPMYTGFPSRSIRVAP